MNFEQTFVSSPVGAADNTEVTMDQAMSALRQVAIEEVEVSPDFDAAVMRRHRLAVSRRKLTHWMPGALAAVLAALALLTFLQLVAVPSTTPVSGSVDAASGR